MSPNLNTWDVFWTNQLQMRQCSRKMVSGRRVAGVIRTLVYARSFQLKCTRVLDESSLVHVLMYSSETMIWREKEEGGVGKSKL